MNYAKKSARDFMSRPIPPQMLDSYNKEYGLSAPEGCTFREALKLRILQLAREGNTEAKKSIAGADFADE